MTREKREFINRAVEEGFKAGYKQGYEHGKAGKSSGLHALTEREQKELDRQVEVEIDHAQEIKDCPECQKSNR